MKSESFCGFSNVRIIGAKNRNRFGIGQNWSKSWKKSDWYGGMVRYGLFSTSNGFQPTKNLVIKIKSFDSLAHFALIFALNSNEFAPFVALTFTNFALKLNSPNIALIFAKCSPHFALVCTQFYSF